MLATGGSLVSEPATFERLLTMCYTVWLRATPEEHMQRVIAQGDMRPMADNRESMSDLKRILEVREPLYRKADLTIDTSDIEPGGERRASDESGSRGLNVARTCKIMPSSVRLKMHYNASINWFTVGM